LGQHVAALAQRVALDLGGMGQRLHGFRARLQDVQLAGVPVLAPLDVHRPAVVRLDHQRLLRQLLDIRVGDGKSRAQLRGRLLGAHALARRVRIHHSQLLAAQRAAQDGRPAGVERGLVDVELVRVHRALHDHLAQAVAGGDEHHVAEAGFGIEGEQHAGGANVGTHHQLHAGGQEHVFVPEAVVHAVGDGAVVVQAGEHFLDLAHHVVGAGHVEEGFLLAGETCVGQILGGGGGAHGDGDVGCACIRTQLRVGGAEVGLQFRLQRRIDHPAADLGAGGGERGDVLHVERGQLVVDARVQRVVGDEGLECVGGGGEAAGHRDAQPGQLADHLAKRAILAAHLGDVGQAQVVQPEDVAGQGGLRGGKAARLRGGACFGSALFYIARAGR
jgi:hypothetical protein